MNGLVSSVTALVLLTASAALPAETAPADAAVTVWPAPVGEPLSTAFVVTVNGRPSPVYVARVPPQEKAQRDAASNYAEAAFTTFGMRGPVTVRVTCPGPIASARVLPSSLKIVPVVNGKQLTLTMTEPKPLTVEVNDDWVHSLHLFGNPPEETPPRPDDPQVVYFGPGVHEIGHLEVGGGKTVYLAGGAVVRGVIQADEPFHTSHSVTSKQERRSYRPTIQLHGQGITLRGRGILDGSACPHHARNLLAVEGSDIRLEGIILRDSGTWNIPIRRSDRVSVQNIKVFGYRGNSDGIDICNSRDVTVERCFLRTWDDLIVFKTDRGQGEARHIIARDCVLWNEVAHALSVGAELRENVDDVLFTNCDVIHDKGREWTLRVFHCDSARVSNVRFSDLRIEDSRRLISLWISKAVWTRDEQRGHIDGVTFDRITATGSPLKIELQGYDAEHQVENVAFRAVLLNGKPLTTADVKSNPFVRNVTISPSPPTAERSAFIVQHSALSISHAPLSPSAAQQRHQIGGEAAAVA